MSYFQKLPELYRKLIYFTGLIWTILVVGTAGFKIIQPEFSLLDAFYMTTITLSTVGFQEVNPLGESAKLFTVFLIAIGITTLGYGVSSITSIIVEGQIKNTFRDRKMEKAIKKLKNHIVLCGYGRLGNCAGNELEEWNKPFVIIEHDQKIAEDLIARNKLCIHGSAVEDKVLLEAGVERAEGLISALSQDTDNLFVALTARRLNPDLLIISRVEYESSEVKLISAGADKVLSPTHIAGRRMATMLINPEVVNFLDVVNEASGVNLTLHEYHIKEGSELDNVQIKDSNIPRELRIIGLRNPDGEMFVNPVSSTFLRVGQVMIILGERSKMKELNR